jgi:primosomal protein N'
VREKPSRFVEVALPLPLFQNFTYAVEEGLANPVVIGSSVVFTLRNGR